MAREVAVKMDEPGRLTRVVDRDGHGACQVVVVGEQRGILCPSDAGGRHLGQRKKALEIGRLVIRRVADDQGIGRVVWVGEAGEQHRPTAAASLCTVRMRAGRSLRLFSAWLIRVRAVSWSTRWRRLASV